MEKLEKYLLALASVLVLAGLILLTYPKYVFFTEAQGILMIRCNRITGQVDIRLMTQPEVERARGGWSVVK